jgi:uncharacterized membrane protein
MQYLISIVFVLCMLCSCTSNEEVSIPLQHKETGEQAVVSDTASHAGYAAEEAGFSSLPKEAPIRLPKGIYHAVIPVPQKRLQTIQFFPNHDFMMQEKYTVNKTDSIVTTTGTWAPSNGFIWLYKGHVAWGRYQWTGNVLSYYSPVTQKTFPMQKLTSILENNVWKRKPGENVAVFGIGNEPFWSVEHKTGDSIVFLLADEGIPARMKIVNSFASGDSLIYEAKNDSAALRMVVLPYFCNDGMSDHTYPNKILVQYNQQNYNGCGVRYQ